MPIGRVTNLAAFLGSIQPLGFWVVGTDAAFAPGVPLGGRRRRTLRNISEVRHFFRTNDVPIYFVGATPFNLLGLDRWVRNLSYVAYYDAWDGAHPRVFAPAGKPARASGVFATQA